jgi:hypothetical protein
MYMNYLIQIHLGLYPKTYSKKQAKKTYYKNLKSIRNKNNLTKTNYLHVTSDSLTNFTDRSG